jgi:N-succinyldiaminopimelate aminotransferase
MDSKTNAPITASEKHAFRSLPFMGVIRVNNEAAAFGYQAGDPSWSNLGQGQPEFGPMAGAPPRVSVIKLEPTDHAYGPVEGVLPLRERIAAHYNRLFRAGKRSLYRAENVAIASGGRLALSRAAAALDCIRLGYFSPDYTAYEDLLATFPRIEPVRMELSAPNHFRITPADFAAQIEERKLDAVMISNPCNPTGVVIRGSELAAWVEAARRRSCTLFMDEFYSHYFYGQPAGPVSAAAMVENVDEDPVVILDGLTKCFRYPGWRVGWILAPREMIKTITAAGSFLDGGPPQPMQRAALKVLEPACADQETDALRRVFAVKQRITIERLSKLGIGFEHRPEGTFYAWGDIGKLPPPLNNGIGFMREAFKHRVLTVPGEFFDVQVAARNQPIQRSWTNYVRFSFGPPRENLEAGIDRLAEMIQRAPAK